MKHCFVIFFLLLIAYSCEKVIEIDLSDTDKAPIVNCLFCPNNYFKVKVSYSQILTDTSQNNPVDNATVLITAIKSGFAKELHYQGNGVYYDSLFYPAHNETYKLEVEIDGFDLLTAIDSLPPSPNILGVELTRTGRLVPDDQHYEYHNIDVGLNDLANYINYYELRAYEQRSPNSYASIALKSDEPFIINEGDREFSDSKILFGDELFDGQMVNFSCSPKCLIGTDSTWNIDFYVISISPDFYKFRKTAIRHWAGYSQQDIFNSIEPVPMYTNITNGYGIFAGYDYTKIKLYPIN